MFTDFERQVLNTLVTPCLGSRVVGNILEEARLVSLEHTGVGYFLTVSASSLPVERVVCNKPLLIGSVDGVECGFVVFIEDRRLTLECHSWGDAAIPVDIRERAVSLSGSSTKGGHSS